MSIKFGSEVSLNEFANLIANIGTEVTVIGQGQPGIGKSSVLKMLGKRFPDYELAYIDACLLDLGDFALPYTEYASGAQEEHIKTNSKLLYSHQTHALSFNQVSLSSLC